MILNITAGEELNKILSYKFPNDVFIPFNEAMIKGSYNNELFSDDFMKERAITLGVSTEEYLNKMAPFVSVLNHLNVYEEIHLYFGDEPFCNANKTVVIDVLKKHNYTGKITLFTVNELTGSVLNKVITL